MLIPIPKKGGLSECDNWRGISPLDVVRKVVACGIKDGCRSRLKMSYQSPSVVLRRVGMHRHGVFALRQLAEKPWEQLFITFVDLKKAYVSEPRQALWRVLRKLRTPDTLVSLIESFHQYVQAELSKLMDLIAVRNGLRQSCCVAPVLFMCAIA